MELETNTKECSSCKVVKPANKDFFYSKKESTDGLRSMCKICETARRKDYKQSDHYKNLQKENWKEYRKDGRAKEWAHDEYKKYREIILEKKKEYYQRKKDEIIEKRREYRKENKEKCALSQKKSYQNRGRFNFKEKFRKNLRTRIYLALKGKNKSESTMILIGCTIDELKMHLSKKFTEGMTWENYGKWHVDHIIPCTKFDLTCPVQQKVCFNFLNLQPLWAIDNIKKSNKI